MMTERTNETWLRDLKSSGDAHTQALQDLRDFMLRGIMGYLHTRSDLSKIDTRDIEELAQDTVQEALLKVQDKLDTFQGKSKLTTWATKIAINHLISELRRQHWQNVSLQGVIEGGTTLEEIIAAGPGHAGNPSLAAERQSVWREIVGVLENELTDRQRQALVTTQLNGVPLPEAARMLNTNTNNLYKLLHDARLKLKKKLATQGLEPTYVLDLFAR
jgi:RNA polymerase sigma-70 factor (ECF subfamily)